ncbi:uncharacterized protein LOC127793546 isoform X2 [Diospyros lotus]|nr:uncharacterized protein LOC127793546 isoform X2 [Diospyros lotus]
MEKLSQHFGAIDLRNTLHKLAELSQMDQTLGLPSDKKSSSPIDSRNDRANKREGNNQTQKPLHSDTPVKYGVSPAKVAQVERQSSTESEESSYSSEEDQQAMERSRTLIRSASPRRSASPMRRVQIGRSGSRRSTALTIKSLNFFPARDRTLSYRDTTVNSSEEEGSEQPPKKTDSNVQRMSVQDAINLFESKQRDQNSDSQKRRSTLDALTGPNKSVLRRWSAGTGGSSTKSETVSENFVTMTSDNLEGVDISRSSQEEKPEPELISGDNNPVEAAKVETTLDTSEERIFDPIGDPAETIVTQQEENNEKLLASAEWTRQKEMELNQMLKKMMENKPVKYRTTAPNSKKKQDVLSQDVSQEQRGGFYDHYKGKRDAKLQRETAEKRAEREAQFKAMQQILDARKAEMASSNVKDFGRRSSPAKPQKLQKSLPQSANPKKESSKPAIAKKTLSKAPPAPALRKSWPSAPSPRATTGISPARTPCGTSSAGITPTRRKPQTAPSAPRSSPKTERSLHELKNVKASQNDNRKGLKSVTEKTEKQQKPLPKNGKTAKPKVKTSPNEGSTVSPKPSFYSKVTKKSTVVPVESKPFLRKGSGAGPGIVKTKPSQPDETLRNSANSIQAQEDEMIADTSNPIPKQEADLEPIKTPILESVTQVNSPQKCDDTVSSEQVVNGDDNLMTTIESSLQTETEEESVISPTAWVEIEEHHDLPIPQDDSASQIASTANDAAVPVSSPRVRHSLSQMLLEESAEPDIIEWGNAENPPGMVYQKDVPRGLKRLLKFARKSRADPNLTGWSSPSVFSEGEDEFDESKAASKKNADNLLRKAGLHPKNYMQQKMSLGESFEKKSPGPEMISAQSATSKFSSQSSSSHKLQDHFTGAANATKATRSFFSLSAFRGSKPNETKLR